MGRRFGRPATLAQVIVAVAAMNVVTGVVTAVTMTPAPTAPADPLPVVEQVTPRQLARIIGRALAEAPDTPDGERMTDALSGIVDGSVVVVPSTSVPTAPTVPATSTTGPPSTTVRNVVASDWSIP